jgi:SHS2 domain-containing protein
MAARSEFLDHTCELALRLEADTWAELVAEAVRATGAELAAEGGGRGPAPARAIALEAPDREALLVDLINELVFLAETERWAPDGAPAVELATDRALRLRCGGVALAAPPSRIKAATFHGLSVRADGTGASAEVILDV